MGSGLEGNLSPEKATKGLRILLEEPVLKDVVPVLGRMGVGAFCEQAIPELKRRSQESQTAGYKRLALAFEGYATVAQQVLDAEKARRTIPNTPFDAEPRMWHDPEGGGSYIVVGNWPGEGYVIKL